MKRLMDVSEEVNEEPKGDVAGKKAGGMTEREERRRVSEEIKVTERRELAERWEY